MFKVGDRVMAIATSGCNGFIKGHYYIVTKVTPTSISAIDSNGLSNGWSMNLFVPVSNTAERYSSIDFAYNVNQSTPDLVLKNQCDCPWREVYMHGCKKHA